MQKLLLLFISITISLLSFSQGPTAQFTATPLSVCIGDNVTFNSTSINGNSPINHYSWNFGDGNSATTQNATHAFTTAGTYTITLVVTDQNNLADPEVKLNYITVNPTPVSQFTFTNNGCILPAAITFNNQSSSGSNFSYAWNFGNTQTSTQQNPPTISYANTGTYNVDLLVTNTITGCHSTISNPLTISTFSSAFTVQDSACVGSNVSVTDNSTTGVNGWTWNNGNGTVSNNQNPTFTYNTPGTYTITLNSQNTLSGCTGAATHQIVIVPLPNPTFTANPLSGCAPLNVQFTNTTANGSNYIWTFGDGSTFNGQTPPTHIYNSNGNFNVSLTTTGVLGCVKTTTLTNYIQTSPPVADFSAPTTSGCSPISVNFSSTSSSVDPITSWSWSFGDGTTFNGQNPPAHIYNSGIYTVTLTITTQNGCTDIETKPNFIQVGAIDLVNFSYTPAIQCAKNTVTFTDLSVISTPHIPSDITYNWTFGDGGTSTQQNPTWSYPTDTGYFDVQLIVTFRGCRDTMKIDSAVYIKAPISLFSPAQSLYCNLPLPVNVTMNDNAIIGKQTDSVKMIWRWNDPLLTNTVLSNSYLDNNGNGTSSFTYNSYGTYSIKQVVYNYTTGCADSTTQQITISQTVANFTLSNDSICKNGLVTLTSTSTSIDPLGTYSFNMGNGQSVTGSPATYTYPTAGSFNITLTATNNVGCSGTHVFTNMNVLELPVASISPSALNGCAPINVVYTNSSHPQGNGYPTFSSFAWTFPNNTTQTTNSLATPTNYTINTQGTFTTNLIATDGFGCVSLPANISTNITIPLPSFTIDSVLCNHILVDGTNTSTGLNPLTYQWNIDNNNTSNSSNFSHQFNDQTSNSFTPHKITLIATDGNGCIDSVSVNVKVTSPLPSESHLFSGANLNSNNSASCPPIIGNYTNHTTYYGLTPNYYWSFGDGNHSTLVNPQNIFVFAGTYNLSLIVTDQFGCKDSISYDHLTISGPSVSPSIISTPNPCDNNFIFDTTNSVDINHFYWDLGDGTNITSLSNTHNYPNQGNYITTLHIFDANNCEIKYYDTLNVISNQINANFTATPSTAPMGTQIIFDDQSSFNSPIQSWHWFYGDFNNTDQINITDTNTSFIYDLPYLYPVTLVVTDFNGCSDTTTIIVHITGDIEVPNVFTPNGDGTNDIFQFSHNIFKSYDVLILNRWGNVVFENKNVIGTYIWNGKDMKLNECTDGVFYYIIKGSYKDETPFEKNGFVSLISSK